MLYNIIILAAGESSRMGPLCEFLPKILVKLGDKRILTHTLSKVQPLAHKVIIGVGHQQDILIPFIKNIDVNIAISIEDPKTIINNAQSLRVSLPYCDDNYGTLILFCDYIIDTPTIINPDTGFIVDKSTVGIYGTFRHFIDDSLDIISSVYPETLTDTTRGVLGYFAISDTKKLKEIAANCVNPKDITDDFIRPYHQYYNQLSWQVCPIIYDIGTEALFRQVQEEYTRNGLHGII